MKNEKAKNKEKELINKDGEPAEAANVSPKKSTKSKPVEVPTGKVAKVKKVKTEKAVKETAEAKPKKTSKEKEDKLTKFLVTMKKSVRKSIKKEAAEFGISMNEFIVLAVDEKLRQAALKQVKKSA